jgi:hypothetical protein
MKHPLATNMSPFLEPLSNVDLWISIEKKKEEMNIKGVSRCVESKTSMGKVGGGCTLECASIQTQDMYQKKGERKVANT